MTAPFTPFPSTTARTTQGTVTEFDGQIAELADTLFELMFDNGGVGLTASAIGRRERLLVVDLPDASGERHVMALVNPRIIAVQDAMICQSEVFTDLPPRQRFSRIDVLHETVEGETVTLSADGPLAIGLQDQIDRLHGPTHSAPTTRLH